MPQGPSNPRAQDNMRHVEVPSILIHGANLGYSDAAPCRCALRCRSSTAAPMVWSGWSEPAHEPAAELEFGTASRPDEPPHISGCSIGWRDRGLAGACQ